MALAAGWQRYRVAFQYVGTPYSGWQVRRRGGGVCGEWVGEPTVRVVSGIGTVTIHPVDSPTEVADWPPRPFHPPTTYTRAHTHTQRNPLAPRPAVQDVVEAAVRALVGEGNASPCQVSSRTDAGVHALRNVLHVDMCRRARQDVGAEPLEPHPPEVVRRALNARLRGTQVGG